MKQNRSFMDFILLLTAKLPIYTTQVCLRLHIPVAGNRSSICSGRNVVCQTKV